MLTVLLGLLALPQEAPPTRALIIAELEVKLSALGPVQVRAVVEHTELGGTRKVRYDIDLHFRPAEWWMYSVVRDRRTGPAEVFRLYEKGESYLTWDDPKEGDRIDQEAYYKWYWKSQYELDSELAKALGLAPEATSLAKFTAGVKPQLRLDLRSESVDKPGSRVQVAMDRSREGGASWLENLRWAAEDDIVITEDEVIARFPYAGHETVIDRKTGFLKSIGNNYTTGDWSVLLVKEVKTFEKKPDVKKPSKITTRKPGRDDLAGGFAQFLNGYAHESLPRILAAWSQGPGPAKPDALRAFFSMVAARHEALTLDSWHRSWAEGWLKGQLRGGRSLDDVVKNFDKLQKEFQEYIEGGDQQTFDELRSRTDAFKKGLVRRTKNLPGADAAKTGLAKCLEDAFDRGPLDKARAKLPQVDYRGLLRDAIEEAVRAARKQ